MANYEGLGRSNYVRVKDAEAFKAFIDRCGGLEIKENDGHFGLAATNQHGGLPDRIDDGEESQEDIDFLQELAKHLVEADDNVFIWMSVGNEAMRYLTGYAEAVNPSGDETWVNLERDIEAKIKQDFGVEAATRCQY